MLKAKMIELINKEIPKNREKIKNLLRLTIGFQIKSGKTDVTSSKIGGYPSILEDDWPFYQGNPLTFLGQIALGQISEMNNILPKSGVLCFFIYIGDFGYRYPDRKGEFRVIYIENSDDISLMKRNSSKAEKINECLISFFEYFTFPSYQESIIEKNHITAEELDSMGEIESEILFMINGSCETEHQLLGYPGAIQGTVNFWWAMKYLGIEEKDSFIEEEIKLIRQEEENFILLLQINFGDPEIEIDYFGDSVAYFGIHKKDLQNGNFENVILVMQNT